MMSIFQKSKLPWLLATVLLLINLVLLGFIWFGGPPPHRKGGPDVEKTVALFKADLDLDEAQTVQVRQMFTAHFAEMGGMHDSLQRIINESLLSIGNDKPVDSSVPLDFSSIGELSAKLHASKYNHFKAIRALCNADQKPKFDVLLPKLVHGGRRGPKGQGPPPPRR